jgi:hypothetical protein
MPIGIQLLPRLIALKHYCNYCSRKCSDWASTRVQPDYSRELGGRWPRQFHQLVVG